MRPDFSAHRLQISLLTFMLLFGFSTSDAEYLIYLKGGHYIVADDCAFSTRHGVGKGPEVSEQSIGFDKLTAGLTEDCTKGKPKGSIFWSTINGHFGEVNADDVYAIFGGKGRTPTKPSSTTLPLEDYLITNRGQGFVNSKDLPEEKGSEVHGRKRDEPVTLDRRGVIEITPERLATTESGEGLCPKEPNEFAVSDIDLVGDHLVGTIANLSKKEWQPEIEIEIKAKGKLKGKFTIKDKNLLDPGEDVTFDHALFGVESQHLKYLQDLKDPNTGIRICFRKVKTGSNKGTNP